MLVQSFTRYAAIAALVGGLACAGNTAREDTEEDQAAAARDTTSDTTGVQNPPGYRGMERDTAIAPPSQEPSDTFLENQGTGTPQDTSGYSGMERVDTTGQANQTGQDTTGAAGTPDTSGAFGADTSRTEGMDTTSTTGFDTTGTQRSGDTTGYNPSQQADTTSR